MSSYPALSSPISIPLRCIYVLMNVSARLDESEVLKTHVVDPAAGMMGEKAIPRCRAAFPRLLIFSCV
jgi:hypothetical protein